jgi:hypothetical protein
LSRKAGITPDPNKVEHRMPLNRSLTKIFTWQWPRVDERKSPLREDLRTKFKKALDSKSESGAKCANNMAKELSARLDFENAFDALILTVIVPSLNEVARELLRPAGWICSASRAVEGNGILFTVCRPDSSEPMLTRDSVSFFADRAFPKVWAQCSLRATLQSTGIFKIDEITNDLVQETVLEFFQQLD